MQLAWDAISLEAGTRWWVRVPLLHPITGSLFVDWPVMERRRIEVSSVGPYERVSFRVHLYPFEHGSIK